MNKVCEGVRLSFAGVAVALSVASTFAADRDFVAARFAGRDLTLEECRVSAFPMNRVWPGRQRPLDQTKRASFVSFDIDRPGEFELTLPPGTTTAEVRPYRLTGYAVKDGVLRIRLDRPGQFVVRTGTSECHVFADPPWRYVQKKGDRYFGPGRHFPGSIVPRSGERIVLDRGATVYGNMVMLGVTNVTVEGRGILDSSSIARVDPDWGGVKAAASSGLRGVDPVWGTAPVYAYKCGGVTIKGIVFRDAPRWTMNVCDCSDVLIDGVKLVGMWRYNSDGIDICACDRTVVRNSFVRAFDDCLIARPQLNPRQDTPMRDMVVSNCVLWCDWGRNMKVQHGQLACVMSDIRFRDIDCVNVDSSPLIVTTRWGSPGSVISGVSFEDVRIDIPGDRLVNQYQNDDAETFRPRKAKSLLLGLVDCYSMGTPAPNQGTPGKLDPSFFRLDYSDIVMRNFRVYDRPGHLVPSDSPVKFKVTAATTLPRFRIRELVVEDMPMGTRVETKGDVNAEDPLVADPSVFASGGRYYLVGTEDAKATGRRFEGDSVFPLLVSDDLDTWREVPAAEAGSRVLRRSEAFGDKFFWAPQLFACGNRFGFAYTCDFHWGIALADKPTGPFVRHAEFPKGKGRIDPSIFVDDDKRVWACFSDWGLGGIGLVELSPDLKRFIGEPRLCVHSDQPWERRPLEPYYHSLNQRMGYTDWDAFREAICVIEGPSLVKRGGKYVMFYSANDFRSPDYCVGVAVADALNGPWKKLQGGPVLSRRETQLAGTGHGDVFCDKEGVLWYVFHYHHSARKINTRRTALVRLKETFDADGYPRYQADPGSVRTVGVTRSEPVDYRGLGEGGPDEDAAAVLNAAFGRGIRKVRFPKGEYRLGSVLRLPSGAQLLAEPEARFVVAPGMATRWIVTNANHESGDKDIVISGGVWDGNCDERPGKTFDPKSTHAGIFFHFHSVKGLKLNGFRAYDSASYHVSLTRVTDFEISDLHLGGDQKPFCQDGIHMGGGCERGTIRNVTAHTNGLGDDLIALNADDVFFYPWNQDQVALPIRDITVENVVASNCYTVIRLLSIRQPIERCTFRNFTAGYRCHGINMDAARYCSHPIFTDDQEPNGVGALRDIVFENFDMWYSGDKGLGRELVTYETNGRNIQFRNFRFRRDLDSHPDHDRALLQIRHLGETKMTRDGETMLLAPNQTLTVKGDKVGSLVF